MIDRDIWDRIILVRIRTNVTEEILGCVCAPDRGATDKRSTNMALNTPDPEWKKGSAELLVLSLLEDQPRHGYDVSKLIEIRSGGALRFHVTSLYPPVAPAGKKRAGSKAGGWRKRSSGRRRYYHSDAARQEGASLEAEELAGLCRRHQPDHGD